MVRKVGHQVLRTIGNRLTRGIRADGSERISGSFPKYDQLCVTGSRRSYFIHADYRHRQEAERYNDTANSDEWQDEVYRFAHEVSSDHNLQTVLDIGCGSGFKLMKYFWAHTTIGSDVPETLRWLKKRYPDREWIASDFSSAGPKADLVIASDVIEHLADPDELLDYISRISPEYVILSTPDRNLLRCGTHNGPPSNPAHVREWNMAEFHSYVSEFLNIIEHFISNPSQATQCVLARRRNSG